MTQISSFFLYGISLFILTFFGLGPSISLLSKNFRQYSIFIAPAVGCAIFCLFSVWLSAFFATPTVKANYWAAAILSVWACAAIWLCKTEIPVLVNSFKTFLIIAFATAVVVFFTPLHLGVNNYLGTVNPDFFQSFTFHEALLNHNAHFWVDAAEFGLQGPFQNLFPHAFQARFGGVVFSVLLKQLLGVESQAALMLSVMVFTVSLPLTVYFFCRAILGFENRTALLSAVLIIISAPISLSFLHTFIGQNSALAMFPLGIALIYLTLKESKPQIAILTVLVLNGVFFLYVMALPYIIAPFLFLIFGEVFYKKWTSLKGMALIALFSIVLTIFIHVLIFPISNQFIFDLLRLLKELTQSQYYTDFLTEEVFQYATGLTSYPASQNILFYSLRQWFPSVFVGLGMLVAILYFVNLRRWITIAPKSAVILVLGMLATYMAVWFKYTFLTRYGYASFKMASWLQFLFVPFIAWGIINSLANIKIRANGVLGGFFKYAAFIMLVFLYPLLNLLSGINYSIKGHGREIYNSSIINSYGVSGNSNYLELIRVLSEKVPAGKLVALGFGDSVENFYVSHHMDLIKLNTALLSHEELPFEDTFLPNIKTRIYVDSKNYIRPDSRIHYQDADKMAEYFLFPGSGNLNREIISNQFKGYPLWENASFRLFHRDQIGDILVTGRGFNRVEYMDTKRISWWWPKNFRWTDEGGEIYHLNPTRPGIPHHLEFAAIVGTGRPTGERTVEFWHNGQLFDETVIRGAARVSTEKYVPVPGVNLVILKIKEKGSLVSRGFGLWNRDIPSRSTITSALLSDIDVQPADSYQKRKFPADEWVDPRQQFNHFVSFNGFDVDGWVRDQASFEVAGMQDVKLMKLRLLVPGNLNFKFPYSIQIILNGNVIEKSFETPGDFEFDIPVQSSVNGDVSVQIIPSQFERISDGMAQREVLQSLRLSAVNFTK
jgi:hypothetical protein